MSVTSDIEDLFTLNPLLTHADNVVSAVHKAEKLSWSDYIAIIVGIVLVIMALASYSKRPVVNTVINTASKAVTAS